VASRRRGRPARRSRTVLFAGLAVATLLAGGFLTAWLVLDRVELPRVEAALGLNPPYGGFVPAREREPATTMSMAVASPRPGEALVAGSAMLHGTAVNAHEVVVWVQGVNVPVSTPVTGGGWSLPVGERMLPTGSITLVFAARGTGWSESTSVDVIVRDAEPLPEPEPVVSEAPTLLQRTAGALFSFFQPLAAKVVGPVSIAITQTTARDINGDGVPDRVQGRFVAPTKAGSFPYQGLILVLLALAATFVALAITQPQWLRQWALLRHVRKLEDQRFRFTASRERRTAQAVERARQYELTRHEQATEYHERSGHVRGQKELALAKEQVKLVQAAAKLNKAPPGNARVELERQRQQQRLEDKLGQIRREQDRLAKDRGYFDPRQGAAAGRARAPGRE